MKNRISLLISGNKRSNAGIQTLISSDSVDMRNVDDSYVERYAGAGSYIECTHYPLYIKYELRINPNYVSSCDGQRPGDLHISIAIEKGWRLADGKSPYDVLKRVWGKFSSTCMVYRESLKKHSFKDETYDRISFENLLKEEFPLEPHDGKYVEMKGTKPVYMVIQEANIRQLLVDTQYDVLANYSSLYVSDNGSVKDGLQLEIPRPVMFKVLVNGSAEGNVSQKEAFSKTLQAPDQYHESRTLQFTFDDLETNKPIAGCRYEPIDWKNECVRMYVTYDAKHYRRRIGFMFDGHPDSARALKEYGKYELCCKLEGGASSSKRIEQGSDGLYVDFYGNELAKVWTVVDKTNLGYSLKFSIQDADPSHLDSVSKIDVDRNILGFKLVNCSPASDDGNPEIAYKLNYDSEKSRKMDMQSSSSGSLFFKYNLTDNEIVKDIKEIESVKIRFGNRPIKVETRDLKLEGKWIVIDVSLLEKKHNAPVNPNDAKSTGECAFVHITDIKRDAKIIIYFEDGGVEPDLNVRNVKSGQDIKVLIPRSCAVSKIKFESTGFKPDDGKLCRTSDGMYSCKMPKLNPLTKWGRFKNFADKHELFEKSMCLIIGLVIGAIAMFIWNTKPWERAASAVTTTTEPSGGKDVTAGGEKPVEDITNNSPTESSKTFPETQTKSCDSNVQRKVNGYIDRMKTAKVSFDEVADIYKFANSAAAANAEKIDTLKKMAEFYNDAVLIVKDIIAGNISSREDAETKLKPISDKASVGVVKGTIDPLYKFRNSIQTLYLVPQKTKEKSEKFLKAVYQIDMGANTGNPIENVTTFIGLSEAKKKFIETL